MTRILVSTSVLLVCLSLHTLTFADPFECPSDWKRLGTVEEWAGMDSHFHRITGVFGCTDLKVYDFDQRSVYAATMERRSGWSRLDLPEFLALDEQAQEQRRKAARKQLEYVADLRMRIMTRVNAVRDNYNGGWGLRPADHRAVGDVLGRLQEAVGLDPTHVYAWHLLSYFSAVCGDQWRALDALDGTEASLALLPADALPEVRRRAALDRAWIQRDLGFDDEALLQVERAEAISAPDRETTLLRGLIAARAGDYATATKIADQLGSTPVHRFQNAWNVGGAHALTTLYPRIYDPMAWPTRNSTYLKAWVLALMWLHEGETDLAWKVFPEYSLDRHYVGGQRFMNEAAAIYEATGRPDLAARFWSMAHQYVPFTPYLVYSTFGIDLEAFTGRRGGIPVVLAYNSHLMAGSRLAGGVALLHQASQAETSDAREDLAQRALLELETCRRTSWEKESVDLALAYTYALLGDPAATLKTAEAALAELDPQADRERFQRAVSVRKLALQGAPELRDAAGGDLPVTAFETPEQTEARLRAVFDEKPEDRGARRELARWLIRHGQTDEGARLLDALLPPHSEPETEDWLIALELDRQLNDSERARQMLQALLEGRASNWPDPDLWATVGVLCQEHGVDQAEAALHYALELNPENRGLREHLEAAAN